MRYRIDPGDAALMENPGKSTAPAARTGGRAGSRPGNRKISVHGETAVRNICINIFRSPAVRAMGSKLSSRSIPPVSKRDQYGVTQSEPRRAKPRAGAKELETGSRVPMPRSARPRGEVLASRVAVVVIVVLTGLVAVTFHHYGATFDEAVQDDYGHYILDWYRTRGGDRIAISYLDLFYYGGLFDTIAALVNKISPFKHYETRHLLNGLVGVVGLIGCWRLGCRLGGASAGLLSLIALALMPSWYGMMFINPKDIPFATAMVWGTVLLTKVAQQPESPRRRTVIALGLVTGMALGIRIGAVLLLIYLGSLLAAAAMRQWAAGWRPTIAALMRITATIFVPVVAIGWTVMLVFWPFAQLDPVGNPIRTFLYFADRTPDIPTLFFGAYIGADYHPRLYLPVYVVLKLPDVLLVAIGTAIAVGIWRLRRREGRDRRLQFLPLILGITVPLAYVIVTAAELYDAERHFLFLLPLLAVVAALGIRELFGCVRKPVIRWGLSVLLVFGAIVHVSEMVRLHPYEYAFFNSLVGGVAGAAGRFETEYWGAALTEAADELAARLDPSAAPASIPVAICGEPNSLTERLPRSVRIVETGSEARYYLSTTRDRCDTLVAGSELLRVEREGVPFAVVKEVLPALAHVPGTRAGS
ncbi:MAG: glycosyltransferase family 39 protein [Defluviicoccus sp.]